MRARTFRAKQVAIRGYHPDRGGAVGMMLASDHGALIGRAHQLAELSSALALAEEGRGGLVLIVGEPGIGKSALVEAFAALAADRGAATAWGRAWEAGGAPPYWPWIEVLRDLDLEAVGSESDAVRPSLAAAAEIAPELRARFADLEPPPKLEPGQARFRLFESIATLLRWASRKRPVVVVLDDLHAADRASLSLLLFATRAVRRSRVVLVGTFRDVEARLTPSIGEELARVAREGRYLPLERLTRDEVERFLMARGAEGTPEFVEQLYARSEGNPLFLVEMVRLLRGGPTPPAGVPDGVREVIGARLSGLSPECRSVLEVAACLGRVVDRGVLARACGRGAADLRSLLEEAERAEVLSPMREGRLAFTHILLREALHDALSPERRAEIHESIARTLECEAGDPALAEIVEHLFEAAPRIGPTDAIEWARRAARASMAQFAFDEAVAFLERALDASPPDMDPANRCDLVLETATALIGADRVARGRDMALAAAELARRLGDPHRLSRAALSYGGIFTYAATDERLVALLEEALDSLSEGDDELRARLLARLAAAQQPAADPSQPMDIARRAITMGRSLSDPNARLEVLQSATSALLYFAEPKERITLNHELLDLAERQGDRLRTLRAHLRLVFDYLEQSLAAEADASIASFEALASRLGHPSFLWYGPLLRATRATLRGDFDEAEELVSESRTRADRSEEPNRALTFAMHRIATLLIGARDDTLAEESSTLLAIITERTDRWIHGSLRALIAARFGRDEAARAALTSYDHDLAEGEGRLAVGWIAETAVALEDPDLARRAYPRLFPLRDRNQSMGVVGCCCLGPIRHPLAMTAALLGQSDEAWRHFDEALVRVDALASPPLRARIELDYATLLLATESPQLRDRAARLIDSAHATAERLGLPAITDACNRCMDGLPRSGASGEVPNAVPRSEGLTLDPGDPLWTITWGDVHFELEGSRGLQILAQLLARPGEEIHVTDLLAPGGAVGHVEDAGEMLDQTAIAAYRRRHAELKSELDEAEQWNDRGRVASLERELEMLRQELSRAVGRGGRRRKSASTSERARVNVRRRLVHVIDKLEEHSKELAAHLRWAVRTGNYCGYYPSGPPRRPRGTM